MRLCAYIRVSATGGRDTDTATSAPDQRRAIEGYAAGHNIEISEWVEDFDESGGKWERPGFQRALAMVEAREVDGLIVAKLDRFSRSLLDALNGIDIIDHAGGQFVSVADSFDTTTPMGRAMMQISAVFAELERARIRENWALQRADAIDRGVHMGARAPLGYRRGDDGCLAIDPKAAPVVRRAFLQRAAGDTWEKVAEMIAKELGLSLGHTTISNMMRRRAYIGEVRSGDLLVNAHAHEALVSRAEFEAAQPQPRGPKPPSGSLLAGFARCAACSTALIRGGAAQGHHVYRCRGRSKAGRCPDRISIGVTRLDTFIEAALLDRVEELRGSYVEITQRTGDIDKAVAKLEKAEARLTAYRDADAIDVIGADAFRDGLRVRQDAVDVARRAVADAQGAQVIPLGADFEAAWRTGTLAERRILLAGVLDAVFVRRAHSRGMGTPTADRVRILWSGQAPDDLPGRHGGVVRRFEFDDSANVPRVTGSRHDE